MSELKEPDEGPEKSRKHERGQHQMGRRAGQTQVQVSTAEQVWVRFDGKTRLTEVVEGTASGVVRGKMFIPPTSSEKIARFAPGPKSALIYYLCVPMPLWCSCFCAGPLRADNFSKRSLIGCVESGALEIYTLNPQNPHT